jgi:RNA polymerase sigma factor (sigma-70 family)
MMANNGLNRVVGYLRQVAGPGGVSTLDGPQLLKSFVEEGNGAALEELVWRYGGMVLRVCRRHLRNHHDVEDAFQATFLVLVRRARSIRKGQSINSWLYKVAYRVALRMRQQAARRANVEALLFSSRLLETDVPAGMVDLELAVFEELNRMREKYRLPLVLCYLKGLTTAQAAEQLGCPQGTIHSRLSAARDQLRKRLIHRGLTLPAAGLATLFCATANAAVVPARLVAATIRTAVLSQSGKALVGGAAPQVTALAEGVLKSMSMTKLRRAGAVLVALCAVSLGLGQIAPLVFGDKPGGKASLVQGSADAIEVPPETQAGLGIQIGLIKGRAEVPPSLLKMAGVLKYDQDHLFVIHSRFPGELAEVRLVTDADDPKLPPRNRQISYGDKFKQGDLLAVIWSKQLGAARAALVDAVRAVRLSKDTQDCLNRLYQQGSISYAALKGGERQLATDMIALRTAERSLLMWKLTEKEIDDIKEGN